MALPGVTVAKPNFTVRGNIQYKLLQGCFALTLRRFWLGVRANVASGALQFWLAPTVKFAFGFKPAIGP